MPRSSLALVLTLACACAPVSAAVVERLYEASVPVAGQSADARAAAVRDALAAVAVKVSGDRDAAASPGFAGVLEAAPRLLQQYRYEQRGEPPAPHLWARFDPRGVQRALVEHGLPLWGRERPAVLAWVAYDDGFERAPLDEAAPPDIPAGLGRAAEARGLPLVLPLMDLQDRAALPLSDLWGGFDDSVLAASRRYASDAVLVGRLYALGDGRWGSRWILYADDATLSAEGQADTLQAAAAFGPQWAADVFAQRFALVPDAAHRDGRTRVVVDGVRGLADYAGVTRYLESLSPVAAVAVELVDGDRVTFVLELRGSPRQLEQAIALGQRLTPVPDELGGLVGTLRYTLRP